MQDVDGRQQVSHQALDLLQCKCHFQFRTPVEFVCKHFLTELEDAVDGLRARRLFLKDVKKPDKLRVVDQLSQQGDLAHRAVVDSVGHVLQGKQL